ncbi:hypothetical protein OSB04_un000822 [Centaurea solstitialis]|uniref:Uncharacterized protein n=1 Tax=Centaurea solstitialis TaxID=347529 RepID=A0AA38W5J2_9ASTR|nr:hypothetical protein OSB04_un000822 [Centaurea solstitialis]
MHGMHLMTISDATTAPNRWCYMIWKERNNRLFNGSERSVTTLQDVVMLCDACVGRRAWKHMKRLIDAAITYWSFWSHCTDVLRYGWLVQSTSLRYGWLVQSRKIEISDSYTRLSKRPLYMVVTYYHCSATLHLPSSPLKRALKLLNQMNSRLDGLKHKQLAANPIADPQANWFIPQWDRNKCESLRCMKQGHQRTKSLTVIRKPSPQEL